MVGEVLAYLHNYFVKSVDSGTFTITGNILAPNNALGNQYIKIEGSTFNDGVYKYGVDSFNADEEFKGTVYYLAVPKDLESLCNEIEDFVSKSEHSDIQSESFGGYSYTKKSNPNGEKWDWVNEFRGRLKRWRKIANE